MISIEVVLYFKNLAELLAQTLFFSKSGYISVISVPFKIKLCALESHK
jgi:hypothetical protein